MMLIVRLPRAIRSIVAIWARKLRRPRLTDPHRHKQANAPRERGGRGGKRGGIKAERVARRQQDIIKPARLGGEHDIAAMLHNDASSGSG